MRIAIQGHERSCAVNSFRTVPPLVGRSHLLPHGEMYTAATAKFVSDAITNSGPSAADRSPQPVMHRWRPLGEPRQTRNGASCCQTGEECPLWILRTVLAIHTVSQDEQRRYRNSMESTGRAALSAQPPMSTDTSHREGRIHTQQRRRFRCLPALCARLEQSIHTQ